MSQALSLTPGYRVADVFPQGALEGNPLAGGSGNAQRDGSPTVYMMRLGLAPSAAGTLLISEPGVRMDRRSVPHVKIEDEWGVEGVRLRRVCDARG
jgi:hypothetical protein